MVVPTLSGAQPGHHCKIPQGLVPSESIPTVTENDETWLDKCNVYKNYSAALNETEPCTNGWTYDTEVTGNTIVNEVCYSARTAGLTIPRSLGIPSWRYVTLPCMNSWTYDTQVTGNTIVNEVCCSAYTNGWTYDTQVTGNTIINEVCCSACMNGWTYDTQVTGTPSSMRYVTLHQWLDLRHCGHQKHHRQ